MEKNKSFSSAYSSVSSYSSELDQFCRRSKSYSFNGPTTKDPEMKRKRRVAAYNVFTMEEKLKSSVRNSIKWIKTKFSTTTTQ